VFVCELQLGQLVFVRYFTEETAEAISRQLFADSQKLTFLVDGLRNFVSAISQLNHLCGRRNTSVMEQLSLSVFH